LSHYDGTLNMSDNNMFLVHLKHLRGYRIHWIGDLMKEKSHMINEISGMVLLVATVC
jgi:hypothetical protein